MYINTQHVTVDIKRSTGYSEKLPTFTRNDTGVLKIHILDDGQVFDYSTADRYLISFKKPDGTTENSTAAFDVENNCVTYTLGSPEMERVGKVEVTVRLYSGESRITSRYFPIKVIEDLEDGITLDKNYSVLQEIIADVEKVRNDNDAAGSYANDRGAYANDQGIYAGTQGDYAQEKGDYAQEKAVYAEEQGNFAKEQAEYIQTQLDQIVIEGDSSVESAQARVDGSGTVYPTLKQRLDAKESSIMSSLAEKAKQTDVVANTNAIALKADKTYVDTQKSRIDALVSTPNSSFYQKSTNGTTGALLVVSSGATTGQINLASVTPVATGYTPAVGDYVLLVYGVASGSAELIDGRTAASGFVYTNTGGNIRSIQTGDAIKVKAIKPHHASFISRQVELYNDSYYTNFRFSAPSGAMTFTITSFDVSAYAGQTVNLSVDDISCPIASKVIISLRQLDVNGATISTSDVTTASKTYNLSAQVKTLAIRVYIEYTLAQNTDSYYGYRNFIIYQGNLNLSSDIHIPGLESRVTALETNTADISKMKSRIAESFTQIETNSARLSKLEGGVPSYYESHITQKINTINNNASNLSKYAQFVFITDGHYDNGIKNSQYLIERILKNTDINLIINGGDHFTTGGTWNEKQCLDAMREATSMFNMGADYRFVLGNHDNGMDTVNGQLTAATITNTQVFNTSGMRKNMYDVTFDPKNQFQYYWDDTVNNIRFIAMAFGLDYITHAGWTNAWNFLADSLLSAPANSKIIVLNHVIRNGGADVDASVNDIVTLMDNYNNRAMAQYGQDPTTRHYYTNSTGRVILFLGGHTHLDWNKTSATNFPIVITTTDNCFRDESGLTRTPGTITEQAFDVVTVDLDNNKLLFTRVGSGSDRVFTF